MHMADALLSPVVGGTMLAVSASTIAYCSKKVREEFDERKVPLMGVLGAFIFAAQMINFTIPATGSSGHLGGGLLLAILLGPHAAFLAVAFLPDYTFKKPAATAGECLNRTGAGSNGVGQGGGKEGRSPVGSSVAGIVGGVITVVVVFLAGILIKKRPYVIT